MIVEVTAFEKGDITVLFRSVFKKDLANHSDR